MASQLQSNVGGECCDPPRTAATPPDKIVIGSWMLVCDRIPKDGPSAGVAMFVALSSLLIRRSVRSDTAMTGEISLRGLVLPIGGVKEKVLAAARAGITTVLLPSRNKKDLEDVPDAARKQVRFVWLDRVDDALSAALEVASQHHGVEGKHADAGAG